MAYGYQASLEGAVAKLDRAADRIAKMRTPDGQLQTEEQLTICELSSAIAYALDAIRYLKDGVP